MRRCCGCDGVPSFLRNIPQPRNCSLHCVDIGGIQMGEFIETSASAGASFQLIGGVLSLMALGMYALFQPASDDDDSDGGGGGGLMQPVA